MIHQLPVTIILPEPLAQFYSDKSIGENTSVGELVVADLEKYQEYLAWCENKIEGQW